MKTQNALIARCAAILEQGIKLIEEIDDELYATPEAEGKACVGTHFRHNLDFILNFLSGIGSGKIDYDKRERDLRIEQNREYAVSKFKLLIEKLNALPPDVGDKRVSVKSEESSEDLEIGEIWCDSSVLRELEFLHSHTLHHYALIADKLSRLGFTVDKNFGVAPSTLQYWTETGER